MAETPGVVFEHVIDLDWDAKRAAAQVRPELHPCPLCGREMDECDEYGTLFFFSEDHPGVAGYQRPPDPWGDA